MKTGQYDITDGKFMRRYVIHKIMKKTADVAILMSYNGGLYTGQRYYRYPKTLLSDQIQGAIYTKFK